MSKKPVILLTAVILAALPVLSARAKEQRRIEEEKREGLCLTEQRVLYEKEQKYLPREPLK